MRPEHHDACEEDNDGSGNDNDEHACHVPAGRQPDQRVRFTLDFTLEHRRTYSDSAPSVWYQPQQHLPPYTLGGLRKTSNVCRSSPCPIRHPLVICVTQTKHGPRHWNAVIVHRRTHRHRLCKSGRREQQEDRARRAEQRTAPTVRASRASPPEDGVPETVRRSTHSRQHANTRATEQTLFTDRAYAKRTNQPPDVMAPCLVGMFSASPPRQKSLENSRKSKGASLWAIDPVPRWSGARRRPERGAPIVAKNSLCNDALHLLPESPSFRSAQK